MATYIETARDPQTGKLVAWITVHDRGNVRGERVARQQLSDMKARIMRSAFDSMNGTYASTLQVGVGVVVLDDDQPLWNAEAEAAATFNRDFGCLACPFDDGWHRRSIERLMDTIGPRAADDFEQDHPFGDRNAVDPDVDANGQMTNLTGHSMFTADGHDLSELVREHDRREHAEDVFADCPKCSDEWSAITAREDATATPVLCVNVWQAANGQFGMTCYDRDGQNASMVPAEFDTFDQAVADVEAFRSILARS